VRIAYAGTPAFAVPALEALHAAGHQVALVLTQPDRPAGRGLKLSASAVAQCAERLALPTGKPASLKAPEAQELIAAARAEVLVVAAYGLILPKAVLAIPARGCLNIHASLLPRWRGAAPVHRAILAGDARTGVSIMQMEEGLDTGPVLLECATDISAEDTAGSLTTRLAVLGAEAIVQALRDLASLQPRVQDAALATYAAKITREEARIDWNDSSDAIARKVRAFEPQPGADAVVSGELVKIWRARATEGAGAPGEVLQAGTASLVVACGRGALEVEIVQRPGGRRMAAADFIRGRARAAGLRSS
jgi:methionyl-tRNA formyltransferase